MLLSPLYQESSECKTSGIQEVDNPLAQSQHQSLYEGVLNAVPVTGKSGYPVDKSKLLKKEFICELHI